MDSTLQGERGAVEMEWYMFLDAPIAELAEYAGVGIDEAVKMRVGAALDAAKQTNIEVTARPITPQGNLYGFASVTIGGMTVDDFKIVENKDGGLFVGMPSKPDKGSKTGYRNTVHIDKDFRDDFSAAVIGAYNIAVEQAQTRAASMKAAPDKPRIGDQIDKAAKEAGKHNAALPAKEKGGKKHEVGRE